MDEAEEEAMFARLRAGLAALRRNSADAGTDPETAQTPEISAALARLEASVRTIASGLDALAQRTGSLEGSIESQVEEAVARNTAGLRLDLSRLENKVYSAGVLPLPPGTPPVVTVEPEPRPARRRTALFVFLLVLIACAGFGIWVARSPQAGDIRRLVTDRFTTLRDRILGKNPAPTTAQIPGAALTSPTPEPTGSSANLRPAASASASQSAPAAPMAGEHSPAVSDTHASAPDSTILIRATAPAWVKIRERSGKLLLNRTMHPGETWHSPGEPGLTLSTGNAAALVVEAHGKTVPLPAGRVARDVALP